MLYKNWPGICRLRQPHFVLAIALSRDQAFLEKVAKGFPELFLETKPERDGPFPLSWLKELATEWQTQNEQDISMDFHFRKAGMPSVLCAHPDADIYGSDCLPMPPEIAERKMYERLIAGYRSGAWFPFSLKTLEVGGQTYYIGYVNDEPDQQAIVLYPVEVVDVMA